jgi:hypothetical protein
MPLPLSSLFTFRPFGFLPWPSRFCLSWRIVREHTSKANHLVHGNQPARSNTILGSPILTTAALLLSSPSLTDQICLAVISAFPPRPWHGWSTYFVDKTSWREAYVAKPSALYADCSFEVGARLSLSLPRCTFNITFLNYHNNFTTGPGTCAVALWYVWN